MMAAKDERIRLTGELLRGLRPLRMIGWEGVVGAQVSGPGSTF